MSSRYSPAPTMIGLVIAAAACVGPLPSSPPDSVDPVAELSPDAAVADSSATGAVSLDAMVVPPPDRWPLYGTSVHDGCRKKSVED